MLAPWSAWMWPNSFHTSFASIAISLIEPTFEVARRGRSFPHRASSSRHRLLHCGTHGLARRVKFGPSVLGRHVEQPARDYVHAAFEELRSELPICLAVGLQGVR